MASNSRQRNTKTLTRTLPRPPPSRVFLPAPFVSVRSPRPRRRRRVRQLALNLADNGITDRGAALLSVCLQHNATLCALVLDGNPEIGRDAERRITEELETRSMMPEVLYHAVTAASLSLPLSLSVRPRFVCARVCVSFTIVDLANHPTDEENLCLEHGSSKSEGR